MISGGRIGVRINMFKNDIVSFNTKNDVLVCLVHLGYLAYDESNKEVYIPIKEVMSIFEDTIQETTWTEIINTLKE